MKPLIACISLAVLPIVSHGWILQSSSPAAFARSILTRSFMAPNDQALPIPSRRHGDDAFVVQYLDADQGIHKFEISQVLVGESWDLDQSIPDAWSTPKQALDIFSQDQDADCTRITHLDLDYMRDNLTVWTQRIQQDYGYNPLHPETNINNTTKVQCLAEYLKLADQAYSQEDWEYLQKLGYQNCLYDPISVSPNPPPTEWSDEVTFAESYPIPVLLHFKIPKMSSVIQHRENIENSNNTLLLLEVQAISGNESYYKLLPSQEAATFWAVVDPTKSTDDHYAAQMVLFVVQTLEDGVDRRYITDCPCYDNIWDCHQNQTSNVEGVVVVDTLSLPDFQSVAKDLNDEIDRLEQWQSERGMGHYHPHSNGVVRDLVHPSMFALQTTRQSSANEDAEVDEDTEMEDCFGRKYETNTTLCMLPTNVKVSRGADTTSATFEDYINNLVPRHEHEGLYTALQELLGLCFPFIENVHSYNQAVQPYLEEFDDCDPDWYDQNKIPPLEIPCRPLHSNSLQVIPKIVDYEFSSSRTKRETGAWHVEGIPQEHIALTCVYILDRDEDVQGGDIQFQRPLLNDEIRYLATNHKQYPHAKIYRLLDEGYATASFNKAGVSGRQPLGTVSTPKGRLLVFSNLHIHRLTEPSFCPSSTKTKAKRRVVIFFVVDPERRTVSTSDIRPQQQWAGGTMTMDGAKANQRSFMAERVSSKQNWNLRTVSLCEH